MKHLFDINIEGYERLAPAAVIKERFPASPVGYETVEKSRLTLKEILDKKDPRKIIVVGPCSIHDLEAAKEFAHKLYDLSEKVSEQFFLVMRTYFEKPRTIDGWKGLISDPNLDNSFDMETGFGKARELLVYISELGVPTATEFLGPLTPQYIDDLVSWAAIGARTTESQTHREMASGLSMPVGYKNSTDGSIEVAINALKSGAKPHRFLGCDQYGTTCIVKTKGNKYGHIILRGANTSKNYDQVMVEEIQESLARAGLPDVVMIDCSHANSDKDYRKQPAVFRNVINQIVAGNSDIIGLMLESNLQEGNQKIPENVPEGKSISEMLTPGVSITDACMSWETTESIILSAYEALKTGKQMLHR